MNELFQENKNTFLLLLGLLFLLLIVLFFLVYQPVSSELKTKESETDVLKNEIAALQMKVENTGQDDGDDKIAHHQLAGKLPMRPELEKMIRTLEEIEYISNSRFDNITFSYDGSVPELASQAEEMGEAEEENDEINGLENNEEMADDINPAAEEQQAVINMEEKPENLHIITMSMRVSSPDYEHFQTFINEAENLERMMTVSSMDFQKPSESDLYFEENPDESIDADVTMTAFYYE